MPNRKSPLSGKDGVIERKPVERASKIERIEEAGKTESTVLKDKKPLINSNKDGAEDVSIVESQPNLLNPQPTLDLKLNLTIEAGVLPSQSSPSIDSSKGVILSVKEVSGKSSLEASIISNLNSSDNAKTPLNLDADLVPQAQKLSQFQNMTSRQIKQSIELESATTQRLNEANVMPTSQFKESIDALTKASLVKPELPFSEAQTQLAKKVNTQAKSYFEQLGILSKDIQIDANNKAEGKIFGQQNSVKFAASNSSIPQDLLDSVKLDPKVGIDSLSEKELQAQIFSKQNNNLNQSEKIGNLLQQSNDSSLKAKPPATVPPSAQGLSLDQLNNLNAAQNPLNASAQSFAMSESLDSLAATALQANSASSASNLMGIQNSLVLGRNFTPNLAMRVQWMVQQASNSAEIMLDPPELGPLTVKLHNQNGETNVIFHVNNGQAKDLIEANLAKLKELLAEQGISLGDTQVEQQNQQEKQASYGNGHRQENSSSIESTETAATIVRQGLLDAYI
ncbi:MAG: flagellar hook-length control protein FliK [Enterobacterales bacterium]|nr:flagellar hook-length control protein FliK [Enterobacterales bacterium]